MRVLYVWDAEYPWDVRTEKVCRTLTQSGHLVVITARNVMGRSRSEVRPEGIVERLPSFPHWGRRALSFPAFFNPFWLWHVHRLGMKHAIDLIIVRDLPLAPTALFASNGRWPVILDMAENYPAMIADIWADGRQRRLDALVRNPRIVSAVERFTLARVAHTMTVVEESKDRLRRLGVPENRLSVVSNTPAKAHIAGLVPRSGSEPLRMVYLGLMEAHRGIAEVLMAAQELAQTGVRFHLDLVGDGRDFDLFRDFASQLGLSSADVAFHGRLSHEDALAVVRNAHVGLVPHHATDSWNTTIPNKLFDYMAAGLAVVSSDAAPAARVVRNTNAGRIFQSGNAFDLADQLRQLIDVPRWHQYRIAGQDAIRSRYNWESDTEVLLDVILRIGTNKKPPQAWQMERSAR